MNFGSKEVSDLHVGSLNVVAAYFGAEEVWQKSTAGKTKVKYTAASGLPDWEGNIVGELDDSSIPNKSSAETVEIGTNVTSIGEYAFYGCANLALVDFTGFQDIPSLDDKNAFGSTSSSLRIVVPNDLYEDWATEDVWIDLVDKIVQETPALTFKAGSANSTLMLSAVGSAPSVSLETSNDGGSTWTPYTVGQTLTLLNAGDELWMRAAPNASNVFATSTSNYNKFNVVGPNMQVGGSLNALQNPSGGQWTGSNNDYMFYSLFRECAAIGSVPKVLPQKTLSTYCYSSLFRQVPITSAPALPATALAADCYHSMFNLCSLLREPPKLPATTMYANCYFGMFSECSSLRWGDETFVLPAKDMAASCYERMFYKCTSLESSPALPATTLDDRCCYEMFSGCTSLEYARAIEATVVSTDSCRLMFNGCSALGNAPDLKAVTLAARCYQEMFRGCTTLGTGPKIYALNVSGYIDACRNMFRDDSALHEITMVSYAGDFNDLTSEPNGGPFYKWLDGVSGTGTFKFNGPEQTRSSSGVPSGWTIVYAAPYVSVDYIEADGRQCLVTNYKPGQGDSWELTWGVTVPYSELPSGAGENKGWCNYTYWGGGGRYTNGVVCPWILGNVSYSPTVQTSTVSAGEIFTEHIDTPVGSG